MRKILFANNTSVGVEQLDTVAYALITDEEEDAAEVFNGIVTLVPPPSRQQAGSATPEHPAFTPKLNASKTMLRSFSPAKRSRKFAFPLQ
ncbi:hypothetical protein V7S43_009999 [Phytophthora oleae]|uniref:Uncharacterized protein n=1 Tax=Phytophthora oleae TaxID=2107226 RepID=A0ABD3FIM1_9STRA